MSNAVRATPAGADRRVVGHERANRNSSNVMGSVSLNVVLFSNAAKGLQAIASVWLVDGSVISVGQNAEIELPLHVPCPSAQGTPAQMQDLTIFCVGKAASMLSLAAASRDGNYDVHADDDFIFLAAAAPKADTHSSTAELRRLPSDKEGRLMSDHAFGQRAA